MMASLRLAVVAVAALTGCRQEQAVKVDPCAHVDGSYKSEPIDISKLDEIRADQKIEAAALLAPRCYAMHPLGPYKSYLERLGVYADGQRVYIAFKVAGVSHVALLFRVNAEGEILGAIRTSKPFQTPADGR